MKSLKFLVLLAALYLAVAYTTSVDGYKAYNVETDYGTFTVLKNSEKCEDLKLIFHTDGKISDAAKTAGKTSLSDEDVANALKSSMSLSDFEKATGLKVANKAHAQTECGQSKGRRRHRLHSSRKIKSKIFDTDSVYITTFVNKHKTPKDKLYNSEDEGLNQYFDTASEVKEYWWDTKGKGAKPTGDAVSKDLGLPNANLAIKAVKLYYRISGVLSKAVVLEGNKRFLAENLYSQKPTLLEAAYWFKWKPNNIQDPADIHHEFLELCLDGGARLIVDRGAREAAQQDTFNTRVRFIYLDSTGGDCSLTSNNWLDKELQDKQFTDKKFKVRDGKVSTGYTLGNLLAYAVSYVDKFRSYNTLANCQHFATNTYNILTESTLDYDSIDLMGNHSDKSGNEPKLPFGLNIEKARRNRRRFHKKQNRRFQKKRNVHRRRA